MVSQSPWSVKGIDPEAREAAKIAARRAGLTVGQWLNQAIRVVAAEQLTGRRSEPQSEPQSAPPPVQNAPPYPGHIPPAQGYPQQPPYGQPPPPGYPPQYAPPPQGGTPPAPTLEAIFDSLQGLSKRLEESERKAESKVEPLVEKVQELTEKIESAGSQKNVTTAPLERAVMRLSERVEKMEGPAKEEDDHKGWRLFGGRKS